MKLLISGEGTSDLGACNNAQGQCSDEFFNPGPMAVWLARLWEASLNYNLLEIPEAVLFVSETALEQQSKQDGKEMGKRMQPLRGKKQAAETGLYFSNARQLGLMAKQLAADGQVPVMAVFFRDADGSHQVAYQLADWCQENPTDWSNLLTMPSFRAFFERFQEVATSLLRPKGALA
jgi:hypothetical protein